MKFEEYCWLDSEIRSIVIDRTNPGKKDIILFKMDWSDRGFGSLIFEDVYWANINMNFGIVAPECIECAYVANQNDIALSSLYERWNGRINGIKLYCYVIKTISTGSEIKVIAKELKVVYDRVVGNGI